MAFPGRIADYRTTRLFFAGLLVGLPLIMSACQTARVTGVPEQEYRALLPISQVESYYYTEPESRSRYPLVQGSLVNLGAETVSVVEFTLRFKDSLQRVIHEERAYPVFASDFARAAGNQALSPGQKTRFAFKSLMCPPDWQPGSVEIEITKVVFEKPSGNAPSGI